MELKNYTLLIGEMFFNNLSKQKIINLYNFLEYFFTLN